jgi:hypothetical protein
LIIAGLAVGLVVALIFRLQPAKLGREERGPG